jgi:hypothetical protein
MRKALSRPSRLFGVAPGVLEAAARSPANASARSASRARSKSTARTPRASWAWTAQIGFETALDDMVSAYRQTPA